MVRIDLQITALCSPGHNYPLTFPSPSHTECCWSPLENLMWSFTTPCTDNVIVLLSHAWIFSCDAAGTKKSHLNTWGVQNCAFFVCVCVSWFAEQHICALFNYLIKCMWCVKKRLWQPFNFLHHSWRLVESWREIKCSKLPVLELPLQVSRRLNCPHDEIHYSMSTLFIIRNQRRFLEAYFLLKYTFISTWICKAFGKVPVPIMHRWVRSM